MGTPPDCQCANTSLRAAGRQPIKCRRGLRDAGLWEPNTRAVTAAHDPDETPEWLRGGIDYERLLIIVREGIRLSLGSDARAAVSVLYLQVWRPLEANPALWHRLLATHELGLSSWLLGSRLHLGHSLMNTGHWLQAAYYLRQTIDWMNSHPVEPHQRTWEDTPQIISLRRDDVWLGCYQHLGLVRGKTDVDVALGLLQTAASSAKRSHQPMVPRDQSLLGDLERDLAYLKLRLRHVPEAEICQHLNRAQQAAEDSGSPGIQAFTQIAWAKLYDRLAREAGVREQGTYGQRRDQMERALHQALELMEREQDDRPLRQTLCCVDAAQLAHAHGMPIDSRWMHCAAEYCVTYGYGGQAEQLLAIPGTDKLLSEDVLRNLTRLAHSG